jgi:phasin family protein
MLRRNISVLTFIVHCTYQGGKQIGRPGRPLVRPNRKLKGHPMFTNVEELQKFGKQQFEAVTAATTSVSKGIQELAVEATDYSKKAIEANTAAVEKLLGAKTLENAIQIQTDFAKTAYEGFVAQATKLGDLYAKLAKEAFKPLETAYATASAK